MLSWLDLMPFEQAFKEIDNYLLGLWPNNVAIAVPVCITEFGTTKPVQARPSGRVVSQPSPSRALIAASRSAKRAGREQ
jgi:hypothetical protein